MDSRPFRDRTEAGRLLAERLAQYAGRDDVVVLGLPRGGVPVAYEVARRLDAPLDVFLVRKLGVPGHEELAMGAIAAGGMRVLNQDLIEQLGIPARVDRGGRRRERLELERRDASTAAIDRRPTSRDRTVILVDDGLATGSTMQAAVRGRPAATTRRAIVVAVPVGAPDTCERARRRTPTRSSACDAGAVRRRRPVVRGLLADDRRGGARPAGSGRARRAGPRQRRREASCARAPVSGDRDYDALLERASASALSCCSARRRTARTSSTASAPSSRGA